ncbi:hypothetical protein SAMN04489797_1823 [Winogradskyella sediminis]|uniref:Uncharacterized protein n=1 Tax=Winogradskyella sediminis TaxID=1382466 RepID=A0A1H1T184_9FLAO|nr:hypothetical protein C8N41_101338 [Winogradskyella sediminis]SDS53990.1 hypothetical protein SAMN04489797_1823 [Winogradskyella sediminis]
MSLNHAIIAKTFKVANFEGILENKNVLVLPYKASKK